MDLVELGVAERLGEIDARDLGAEGMGKRSHGNGHPELLAGRAIGANGALHPSDRQDLRPRPAERLRGGVRFSVQMSGFPLPSSLRNVWHLLRDTVAGFIEDDALSRGASIAYYTLFSLAPVLLIAIAIAGLAFGRDAARGAIVEQLSGLMGGKSAEALQAMIESAEQSRRPA